MERTETTDALITLKEASDASGLPQWRILAAGLAGRFRLLRTDEGWSLGRASFDSWLERKRQGPKPPSLITY